MSIAFIDLQAQRARISDKIDQAISGVVESGAYIMGPPVREFEAQLADFTGAAHAFACGNGTDALHLALLALGVGDGDAVFCPAFTFTATAEPIPHTGATPVFVDIDERTYNLDPAKLDAAIEAVSAEGKLKPRAVIAVCLFGQPADYPEISAIAKKHGLEVIADCAQGLGGVIDGKHATAWADVATTSFFPAKPLGCYGDGGAVYTNRDDVAEIVDSLRFHGKASKSDIEQRQFNHLPKYLNTRMGFNSRLDTIQAAILLEKLAIFPDEIEKRNEVAARYSAALDNVVDATPFVKEGFRSVWAQYTIEVSERDKFQAHMKARGVPTMVYYPIPLHLQPCYEDVVGAYADFSVSEAKSKSVVSLPMHPYLDEDTQRSVIDAVLSFYKE